MDDGTSNLESKSVYQCWAVLFFFFLKITDSILILTNNFKEP
jgi:hypothetical protein